MVLWVCIQKVFHSATFRDWTGKGGHLLSEGGLRSRGPPPVMTRGEHPFICLPPLPPERYPVLCPRMETAGTDSGGGQPRGSWEPLREETVLDRGFSHLLEGFAQYT